MALLAPTAGPDRSAPPQNPIARNLRRIVALTAVADVVTLLAALMLAWQLRVNFDVWSATLDPTLARTQATAPWMVVAWFLVLGAQGAYARRNFGAGTDEFRTVATASVITAGLVSMFCYIAQYPISRGFLVLAFFLGTPLLLLERYAGRKVLHRLRISGRIMHRVVAVGGPSGIAEMLAVLRRERYVGYEVVAACVPHGMPVLPGTLDVPVVGSVGKTREVCDELGADTVLVARGGYASSTDLRRIAWDLEGSNIDLVVVPSLVDIAGPRIHMRPVAGLPLLHIEEPQSGEAGGIDKRLFDVLGALLALVVLSPVLAAVALAIKLEDRGPVLFRQRRIGRRGTEFSCLKFRSMFVDADRLEESLRERDGHKTALWKAKSDPRVTRVGNVIRKYSLDELPQLFNVIAGQMSLVGPRPQQRWEVETYTDAVRRRLLVRPGMTGLWQVSGRSELSLDESIRLDLYYVDNWSMTGDVMIMAKTVRAVLASSGAY